MNKKLVLHMLGRLMLVEAGLMLPSLIIAWALKDGDEWPFLLSMLIIVAVALPLTLFTRGGDGEMHTREGMAVAGLSWLTFSLFGSLPLLLDRRDDLRRCGIAAARASVLALVHALGGRHGRSGAHVGHSSVHRRKGRASGARGEPRPVIFQAAPEAR